VTLSDLTAVIVLQDEVAPVVAELHTGSVQRHHGIPLTGKSSLHSKTIALIALRRSSYRARPP
jgi:hypothetical protein